MKRRAMRMMVFTATALCLGWTSPAWAKDDELSVRVQVEFFELSHELMTELMAVDHPPADNDLRKQLAALVKKKTARIIETQVVTARNGKGTTVEAIEEFTYPTEYEPAEIPTEVNVVKDEDNKVTIDARDVATGPTPTAFETRNLGSTLQVEPNVGEDGETIDLRFSPELVYHVRNEVWAEWSGKTGDADIVMPIFYSMRCSGAITIRSGNYRLVAAVSPKGEDGHPDYDRKVFVMVRADVVRKDQDEGKE